MEIDCSMNFWFNNPQPLQSTWMELISYGHQKCIRLEYTNWAYFSKIVQLSTSILSVLVFKLTPHFSSDFSVAILWKICINWPIGLFLDLTEKCLTSCVCIWMSIFPVIAELKRSVENCGVSLFYTVQHWMIGKTVSDNLMRFGRDCLRRWRK